MTNRHRIKIWELPKDEARCVPFEPCFRKHACLRFRALAKPGVPLADFSTTRVDSIGCLNFLPLPQNEDAP